MKRVFAFCVGVVVVGCRPPGADAQLAPPPPYSYPYGPPLAVQSAPVAPVAQMDCSARTECGSCAEMRGCQWCTSPRACTREGTVCGGLSLREPHACINDPRSPSVPSDPFETEVASATMNMSTIGKPIAANLYNFPGARFAVERGFCYRVVAHLGQASNAHYVQAKFDLVEASARQSIVGDTMGDRLGTVSPELCASRGGTLEFYFTFAGARTVGGGAGGMHIQLYRRAGTTPFVQKTAPAKPSPSGRLYLPMPTGGNCHSMECGEDCRSELSACKLDCFRYGSHEGGEQRACEGRCEQSERSCERGCRVPCPRGR